MAALELGSGTVTGFRGAATSARRCVSARTICPCWGSIPSAVVISASVKPGTDRLGHYFRTGFWERNLGLAADVIGRRLMVDDLPYVIVGRDTEDVLVAGTVRVARPMERGRSGGHAIARATISA